MAAKRSSGRSPERRRQRSVRVTVAVSMLAVATAAVALALPTQSPILLSVAAVAAIVLGWFALRIVWTEVLQSRRENAADRASAANAYRSLFTERAAEHAEFTTAMTERLAASNLSVRELQGLLAQARQETEVEKRRADSAEAAQSTAELRVRELEHSIEMLRALGAVEGLMEFDEKVADVTGKTAGQDETAKLA